MLVCSNLRSCLISNKDLATHESQQWRSTLQLPSVRKGCDTVTSLSVQASVRACAASAIPVEAPITGSSTSARLIPPAFLNLVAVVSSAAHMTPPALPFPATSTTASATAEPQSKGIRSGSTSSSSAARFLGAAAKAAATAGGCRGLSLPSSPLSERLYPQKVVCGCWCRREIQENDETFVCE